jgi:hypothetical protein
METDSVPADSFPGGTSGPGLNTQGRMSQQNFFSSSLQLLQSFVVGELVRCREETTI